MTTHCKECGEEMDAGEFCSNGCWRVYMIRQHNNNRTIKSKAMHGCGCVTLKFKGDDGIHFSNVCEEHRFGKYTWIALQHDDKSKKQKENRIMTWLRRKINKPLDVKTDYEIAKSM